MTGFYQSGHVYRHLAAKVIAWPDGDTSSRKIMFLEHLCPTAPHTVSVSNQAAIGGSIPFGTTSYFSTLVSKTLVPSSMSSPIYGASPYRHQTSGPADALSPVVQPSAPPAENNAPPVKRECNDFFFLIPFVAVVVVTAVFAAKYGDDFIDATQVQGLSESSGVKLMMRIVGLSALAAAGMSVVWIAVMVLLAEALIWVALLTIIALNIAAAILLTKKAYDSGSDWYWWPAVVFGLFALLTILYVVCIRKRIKFAAAHLKVAGKAIFRLPMTLLAALVMVGVQIGWAVLWVLGSLGIMFHQDYIKLKEDSCTTESCDLKYKTGAIVGVLCGMLLIYFWVTFVLRNVIGVTTAGTVAA